MKKIGAGIIVCLFLFLGPLPAESNNVEKLLSEVFHVASPSGYEENMISTIEKLLPADAPLKRDSIGSLYMTAGEGGKRFSVMTGVDEIGYIVSGFDSGGYLNLDRVVPVPTTLYDSFNFGHPMIIWTANGPLKGVLALPSLHIVSNEMRRDLQNVFSLENALVDIGVRSKIEAQKRGVEMLDPVTPLATMGRLAGEKRSGTSLGVKVCISLLVDVAHNLYVNAPQQTTTFVWMAQTKFSARGSRPRASLGAVLTKKNLETETFLIVDLYPIESQNESTVVLGNGPVIFAPEGTDTELSQSIIDRAFSLDIPIQQAQQIQSMLLAPFLSENTAVGLFVPVKFYGTPSEIIDFGDVQALKSLLVSMLK